MVEFHGESAHAAYDPWNGRSALDGLELLMHAINLWREHVRPTVRIHYGIVDGGGVPNVVPESASASVWIRDNSMDSVLEMAERLQTMADGAAAAANVDATVRLVAGNYNMIQNRELAKLVDVNLQRLGTIQYTDEELQFARDLQASMGVPEAGVAGRSWPLELDQTEIYGGSTDSADVSWVRPTLEFGVVTAPYDIPWHSWGVVASSGMSIGHKGMDQASKAIAMTMIDLYTTPAHVEAVQAQFERDMEGREWVPQIPPGPPPVP